MPKFLGEIVQNGGDFALLDQSNIRGGFKQVSTLQERDSIIPDKLEKGMPCYVEEDEKIYVWKGDGWALFEVSDSVGKVQFLTLHKKVAEYVEPIYNEQGEVTHYGIRFSGEGAFAYGDIIGWDISSGGRDDITGKFAKIDFIRDGICYVDRPENDILPDKYQTVYLVGSVSNNIRGCVTVIHPYHGALVISQFLNISLDNLNTNYTFRLGQHSVNSWKVYGEDVYFKGTFIDDKGRNLSDLVTINQELIDKGITGLRREFGYDNLLNNPYFIEGMNCWITRNTATYFKAKGRFIMTNRTLLSAKRDGAYVIIENGQAILRLINGYVSQKNENLRKITDLDNIEPPYWVTLIFSYKPVTRGTLRVSIRKTNNGVITDDYKAIHKVAQDTSYHTWKSSFLWDGQGDLTIHYDGEVKIQTFVLRMNDVKNLERKYQRLFELSDTLIEMAEKYLEQSN